MADCHPRPAAPNAKCTTILQEDDVVRNEYNSEEHIGRKPGEQCSHPAVITCDCGSWCGCSLCISVCEASYEFFVSTQPHAAEA
jgi:hypothetical protein